MREMAFPDMTSLTRLVQKFKTKGAQKSKRSNLNDNSTTLELSFSKHVDAQFPDSQASQTKPSLQKKSVCVVNPFSSPTPHNIFLILIRCLIL